MTRSRVVRSRGAWGGIVRSSSVALSLAVLFTTASCGMLIGIEDLSPNGGPDGSSGGAGNDASADRNTGGAGGTGGATGGASGTGGGTGGAAGTGGTSGTGGTAGSSGAAGQDATVTDQRGDIATPGVDASDVRSDADLDARPDGTTTTDGAPPDAGVPDVSVADANDSGVPDSARPDAPIVDVASDQPPTLTIQGRIIDAWRHGVPGVPVTINAKTATTEASGGFTIAGITPPYDVAFTISTMVNNTAAKYGWLYKGLTRSDPTLQVGRGHLQRSAGTLDITVTNVDFNNLPANEVVYTAFGGVDGTFDLGISYSPYPSSDTSWYGPTSTSMNGYALHWTRASSTTLDLPTGYIGYAKNSVALVEASPANIAFDLPTAPVSSGTITGTVTGSVSGGHRENSVFVQFADNAVIQLASDTTQQTTFSYLVPTLSQASITVAASQGYWSTPPYAVIHKDGLIAAQSQTGISLQIPDAPSLIEPAHNTTGVNPTTPFRWSGTGKVFMWAISSEAEYKGIFVVTTEKQGLVASIPDGPVLAPNAQFRWWVENNGAYQTVDEATGPGGWLDSFRATGTPWGAVRGDGSYTQSEENVFTTAP